MDPGLTPGHAAACTMGQPCLVSWVHVPLRPHSGAAGAVGMCTLSALFVGASWLNCYSDFLLESFVTHFFLEMFLLSR